MTNEQRFKSKIYVSTFLIEGRLELGPCWLWRGARDKDGYSSFTVEGMKVRAHKWYFEFVNNRKVILLDHLCRRRSCVNPLHLEEVSNQENLLRSSITFASMNLSKTHCVNGHEFTIENTYIRRNGCRTCRKCSMLKQRMYRARGE